MEQHLHCSRSTGDLCSLATGATSASAGRTRCGQFSTRVITRRHWTEHVGPTCEPCDEVLGEESWGEVPHSLERIDADEDLKPLDHLRYLRLGGEETEDADAGDSIEAKLKSLGLLRREAAAHCQRFAEDMESELAQKSQKSRSMNPAELGSAPLSRFPSTEGEKASPSGLNHRRGASFGGRAVSLPLERDASNGSRGHCISRTRTTQSPQGGLRKGSRLPTAGIGNTSSLEREFVLYYGAVPRRRKEQTEGEATIQADKFVT